MSCEYRVYRCGHHGETGVLTELQSTFCYQLIISIKFKRAEQSSVGPTHSSRQGSDFGSRRPESRFSLRIQDFYTLYAMKSAMEVKRLAVLPVVLLVAVMFAPSLPSLAASSRTPQQSGNEYFLWVACSSSSDRGQSDTQTLSFLGHTVTAGCSPGTGYYYGDTTCTPTGTSVEGYYCLLTFYSSAGGSYHASANAGGNVQSVSGYFYPNSYEDWAYQYGPYAYSWTEFCITNSLHGACFGE